MSVRCFLLLAFRRRVGQKVAPFPFVCPFRKIVKELLRRSDELLRTF